MRRLVGSAEDGFFLNSPLAAFVLHPDGRVLAWNPAATATFGFEAEEVVGKFLPIVPPRELDEFRRLCARVYSGERLTGVETVRRRKDGSEIAVRVFASPYREDGAIVGFLAMLEDRSSTRSLERTVVETRRLLFALVEASPVATIVADGAERIRMWNDAAAKMYGWTSDEVLGQPLDTIAATAAGRLLAAQIRAPGGEHVSTRGVVRERRRDGTEFDAWPLTAMIEGSGAHAGALAHVRDVTAQVEAERKALEAAEQLRALSLRAIHVLETERIRIAREIHDDLGQFLTGARFELSAMRNMLQGDEPALERLAHATRTIELALESARRIASDLRPPLLDAIGLTAAIQMEVSRFQERTGIECNLSLPAEPLHAGEDVATVVYRIVQEALTNVARHADARHIDVRLRRRDSRLYVEVRDDGVGIDEPRARTGALGLVGMRERAREVGGMVRIEKSEPKGTVVSLSVPLPEAT
ncbi:MAG TPA: PAS domain S-box protein [Thermoanaerobaculia bacterium]|nr:PAS domain S-box protein [Thermoanaerobaculia bacterium]